MEKISLDENLDSQFNPSSSFDNDAFEDHWAFNVTVTAISILFLIIGIIASIMTCMIAFRKRNNLQTSLNLFLGTLAIADLLFCLNSIFTYPASVFFESWIYGSFMCDVSTFVEEFHELYTMIIISTSIGFFLCHKMSLKMAYITVFIVVLCTAILSLLRVKFTILHTCDKQQYCLYDWRNDIFNIAHNILKLGLNIVLPFVMIVVSLVLRFILKVDVNASANRLLMVIMIIYALLWCPMIFNYFSESMYVNVACLFIQLTAVYKPIVYYTMDSLWKKEFSDLISQCFKPNRPQVYNMQLRQ